MGTDYRDDAPQYDDLDQFDVLSDRELLLSIARDIHGVKTLVNESLTSIEPLLAKFNSPQGKLALKLFS